MRRDRFGRRRCRRSTIRRRSPTARARRRSASLTFPLVLEHVSDMTTVDDATLLRTMFYLWERLKLVVEPTGALGAAAALEGRRRRSRARASASS